MKFYLASEVLQNSCVVWRNNNLSQCCDLNKYSALINDKPTALTTSNIVQKDKNRGGHLKLFIQRILVAYCCRVNAVGTYEHSQKTTIDLDQSQPAGSKSTVDLTNDGLG